MSANGVRQSPAAWVNDYVGLRYQSKGRSRAGLDCWGLIYVPFLEVRGIELPRNDDLEWTAEDNTAADHAMAKRRLIEARIREQGRSWQEILFGEEQAFDVAVVQYLGVPTHVGLVAARGHLLHIMHDMQMSVCEPYPSLHLSRRKLEFFRYVP